MISWPDAVAHGADLAGTLGAAPQSTADDLAELLMVIARRVVAPTAYHAGTAEVRQTFTAE